MLKLQAPVSSPTDGMVERTSLTIAREPETTEELREHVECNLDVRDRLNDADGYAEDDGEEDTVEDNGGRGLRRVRANPSGAERNSNNEGREVRPLRHLPILLHETSCGVKVRSEHRKERKDGKHTVYVAMRV